MGIEKYKKGFKVTSHPSCLDDPYTWKPSMIFVNSMSDLFHDEVPLEFIKQVFSVMNNTPQHIYQILTKRADRFATVADSLNWTPNI